MPCASLVMCKCHVEFTYPEHVRPHWERKSSRQCKQGRGRTYLLFEDPHHSGAAPPLHLHEANKTSDAMGLLQGWMNSPGSPGEQHQQLATTPGRVDLGEYQAVECGVIVRDKNAWWAVAEIHFGCTFVLTSSTCPYLGSFSNWGD